jgi:two-component system OmpR family response regulator
MTRCLLIEPDAQKCASLSRYLKCFAFTVKSGVNAQDLKRLALAEPFDVILINMAMLGMDGQAMCAWASEHVQAPLIVMTAHSDPVSHVAALESGADDYIDKPHEPREVVAHIRAVLRRKLKHGTGAESRRRCVSFAGWRIDVLTRELTSMLGHVTVLSAAEFRLLSAFIAHPGHVLHRVQLAERLGLPGPLDVNGAAVGSDVRAVDLAVSRLRHKLGDVPPRANLIRTIRGQGYLLDADIAWS